MPIGRSAKKSLRKTVKNHDTNLTLKNKIKLAIKNFLAKPSVKGLSEADSAIDKGVKKSIIHKNKAAHLKSSLSKKVGGEAVTAKKVVKKAVKKTVKRTAKEKMSK